jgi:hypothetical protein
MRSTLARVAVAAVLLLVIIPAAAATSSSWQSGAAYQVQETDVNNLLEKTYDHAYCNGIPRFGHSGSFPDETFRVFDCDMTLNGKYCTGRIRTVKAPRYGYFRGLWVGRTSCY